MRDATPVLTQTRTVMERGLHAAGDREARDAAHDLRVSACDARCLAIARDCWPVAPERGVRHLRTGSCPACLAGIADRVGGGQNVPAQGTRRPPSGAKALQEGTARENRVIDVRSDDAARQGVAVR